MKSFRLIVDQAVSDGCADLLVAFEASKAARGYAIVPRLNSAAMSAAAVRADQQAVRPDYTILIGDSVPVIYIWSSPDGHEVRRLRGCKLFATAGALAIDATSTATGAMPGVQPWGAVSRVWYGAQSGAQQIAEFGAAASIYLYQSWLQKAISWEQHALRYRVLASVDDHFAYYPMNGIGDLVRAQVPAWLLEDKRELPVGADGTDGEWAQWAANPLVLGITDSGGQEFRSQPGLYYAGLTSDWRRLAPRCLIAQIFGSYQCDYDWDNNLIVAATTTPDTVSAVYDRYGGMAFGSLFSGAPIGDASRAYAGNGWRDPGSYLLDIIGDCTMALTADQLAIADLTRRMGLVETTLAAGNVVRPTLPILEDSGAPSDSHFDSGSTWPIMAPVDTAGVLNALPASYYTSGRGGPAAGYHWTGETPGRPVTVRLHLAEPRWAAIGQRLFDVSINGAVALARLDIFARAGALNKAVVVDLPATVDASGGLRVSFATSAGSPDANSYVCAVEVLAV